MYDRVERFQVRRSPRRAQRAILPQRLASLVSGLDNPTQNNYSSVVNFA
jgi:hypothetical protein